MVKANKGSSPLEWSEDLSTDNAFWQRAKGQNYPGRLFDNIMYIRYMLSILISFSIVVTDGKKPATAEKISSRLLQKGRTSVLFSFLKNFYIPVE